MLYTLTGSAPTQLFITVSLTKKLIFFGTNYWSHPEVDFWYQYTSTGRCSNRKFTEIIPIYFTF